MISFRVPPATLKRISDIVRSARTQHIVRARTTPIT